MVFAASMFDGPHLIYIFASLAATALIVWLGVRFIKKTNTERCLFKVLGTCHCLSSSLTALGEFPNGGRANC